MSEDYGGRLDSPIVQHRLQERRSAVAEEGIDPDDVQYRVTGGGSVKVTGFTDEAREERRDEQRQALEGLGYEQPEGGEWQAPDSADRDTLVEQERQDELRNALEGIGYEQPEGGEWEAPEASGRDSLAEQRAEDAQRQALEGIGFEQDEGGEWDAPDSSGRDTLAQQQAEDEQRQALEGLGYSQPEGGEWNAPEAPGQPTLVEQQAIAAAREQVGEQVNEQFANTDLERGEDYETDVTRTADGVQVDAELTDQGRKEIARENAPLQGTPLEAVTETGAAVNFEYEEFRRGLHSGYDDTVQPVEDVWNQNTPDTQQAWNENTPDAPDISLPNVSATDVLGASAAAVAAPEPATSVSGAVVGGATLAGLGAYSVAQNPRETQTTASADITPEDVQREQPEIQPGENTWEETEVDVTDRESVRPEELGVPRDAVERGEAEIQGGEYNPETGEIEIPAEAANAVGQYRYQDEEEEEEDEEEEDEEDEEEQEEEEREGDVVVEVPEEFIPDEEQTIGGDTEETTGQQQQEQQQEQAQQEQQEQGEQAQGDEFAEPDDQLKDGEGAWPDWGDQQGQQDEFADPDDSLSDGDFGDQIAEDDASATTRNDADGVDDMFDDVTDVAGGAAVPVGAGLDEQQDQQAGPDEWQATEPTQQQAPLADEDTEADVDTDTDVWEDVATEDQQSGASEVPGVGNLEVPGLEQNVGMGESATGTPTRLQIQRQTQVRSPERRGRRKPPRRPDLEFGGDDDGDLEDLFDVESVTFDTGVVQSFEEFEDEQSAGQRGGGSDPLESLDELL